MENLDPINSHQRIEIRDEQQQRKEKVLRGNIIIPKGHTLYVFDPDTLSVAPADVKKENTLDLSRAELGELIKGKIEFDDSKVYFTALNLKNAHRKVNNMLKEYAKQ